jgi:3'-phosphoadenosine 5'-phosphosulfate sulfotransferase (PAPS reductase)/FAD synthetase
VITLKEYDIYHVGISGGKDSTAALLWAVHESGWPHDRIRATFCDTGNEHQITYDYIAVLSERVFPIQTIHPPLDFYALAEKKGRFPSTKARFCTQYLKIFPTQVHILEMQRQGLDVLLVSGVRADESKERADLPETEWSEYYATDEYRPLLKWTTEDIWAFLAKYDMPRNPLYDFGARRVGCFPCMMSSKGELRTIAQHFPDRIDMIREWEARIDSTFFRPNTVPEKFRTKKCTTKDGRTVYAATIDDVVAWTKTGYRKRGGQYEMQFEDEPIACNSNLGACE